MREKQLPVNENVFNALIMGHSNADDLESAVGILTVMAQAGLEPSADTYTTLFCGFARRGDIDSINKYIAQCEEKEVYLLDKDFLEVIYALSVNGHGDKVDDVILKMKKAYGYNQDAVNVILRLINKGQEPIAMKILKTMPRATRQSGEQTDAGNFLIKQLIRANRPVEQVLNICRELEQSDMNSKPILVAIEAALTHGSGELSLGLLRDMKARGMEIRQHFFWPVFCSIKGEQAAIGLCQTMQTEFGMTITNQTFREYFVPKILKNDDFSTVLQTLRGLTTTATAASVTAHTALVKNDIAKAAEIMNSVEAYYSPGLFKKPLLLSLAKTLDYEGHALIVRNIHDGMSRAKSMQQSQRSQPEEDEEDLATENPTVSTGRSLKELQSEVVGDLIIDAVVHFKVDRVEVVTNILTRLVEQGVSISNFKAEKIQERLGESMTPEISEMLGKLSSGELEPTAIERQKMPKSTGQQMSVEALERLIVRIEEKGDNAKGMKRSLLVAAIRAKDFEKTEEIVERLSSEGFILTKGVYAQLIELYASGDKLDRAIDAYKKFRASTTEGEAAFELDEIKVVKMVQAFATADRLQEGIKFLQENARKEIPDEKVFNYQATCWRLLNMLAEQGKTTELNTLFEALVANKYVVPNNVLLGPLIKVHLVQDQLKEAVDKFEELCQKYRATPWKNEIACRLIQGEDASNLQRITDLSTEIHGEVNSLYDLVFSFIECGRVRQARKILETPGLKTRPNRINFACERYLNENMPTALEGLIEATKDLNHIDRSEIYYKLLQTYIKENSTEKALGLWTSMQEEDISASDPFLIKLSQFLKANGLEVPFHTPAAPEVKAVKVEKKNAEIKAPIQRRQPREGAAKKSDLSENHIAFKDALRTKNIDEILSTMQNLLPSDKVSINERSLVIEALLQNGRLQDATKKVYEMLAEKTFPSPRIFRYYLNKVAVQGDAATIEDMGKHIDSSLKKSVSFDNRLCHSYVAAGKADEYLKKLASAIDEATTAEQIALVAEEFPRGKFF